ncbi:MAG: hypothetical protein JWQ18_2583 [Conexibacter sp.]|nr:hypothetical protein [Conexibacter sp.]
MDRLRAMSISPQVRKSWLGVLCTGALVGLHPRSRRSARHRSVATSTAAAIPRCDGSGLPSTARHVRAKTFRPTDPALLPGNDHVNSISLRRRSHGAGHGSTSHQRDGLSVFATTLGRRIVSGPVVRVPPPTATRVHLAPCVGSTAARRVERGGWRLFRPGSAWTSAWASLWAAASASGWLWEPWRERPCNLAVFAEFGRGDIFFCVVSRGCWL